MLPSPAIQLPIVAFDGQSGSITGSHIQSSELPLVCVLRSHPRFDQAGGFARDQRYVELIQRNLESFAFSFNVGFFARPAVEKSDRFGMVGKFAKHTDLARGEEAPGYVLAGRLRPNLLYIDPYFPGSAEGINNHAVRVGQVERKSLPVVGMNEGRLSVGVVEKLQIGRILVEITSDQVTKKAA